MGLLRRLLVRNMPLERQLEVLARCGIHLNEDAGISELLGGHDETDFERSPFKLLLNRMGSEREAPREGFLSNDVWRLDIGCIHGSGDYVRVAKRMSALSAGALTISSTADELNANQNVGCLSFYIGDRQFKWPARIEEQWIDPAIMSRFALLIAEQETEKRYTLLDQPGRECLIACSTPQELELLRRETGLNFQWLG